MSRLSKLLPYLLCLLLLPAAFAQEAEPTGELGMDAMMETWQRAATPGEAHEELAQQVGTWNATVKTWMQPGKDPMVSEGTFKRELTLDGRVLAETYEGEVAGQPFNGQSWTGYDNVTERWWTIWTDNMSTGPMVMWGEWNDKKKGIVYQGTTPDALSGEMVEMMTLVRSPKKGEEVMEMFDLRTGEPVKTMEIHARKR